MNLTQTFSASAIIIGIYILFSFFFSQNKVADQKGSYLDSSSYHIGCYLTEHNTTHYDNIKLTLQSLKAESQLKLSRQISQMPKDYLESKGVEVAKNFQHFVQEINKFKSQMQINIDLERAVAQSYDSFKSCVRELERDHTFSQSDCISDWELYLKCSADLGILKKGLKIELDDRDVILNKMKVLLSSNSSSGSPVKGQTADYLKEYRLKDKQLEDKQIRIETEAKILYAKISDAESKYEEAKKNTQHSRKVYALCSENRNQFRLCEELSAEVRSLGHGSIDSLGLKVQKKQHSLNQIQKLMNENEGRESSVELKKLFQSNLQTYKKLLKLYVETKARIIKHCGCTQSEQLQLKSALNSNITEEEKRRKDLSALQEKQKLLIEQLKKIRNDRKLLLEWLEQQTKKLKGSIVENDVDAIMILSDYEKQLGDLENKIIKQENNFKALELNCDNIKARLNLQVVSVSKIKDCLIKHQFYEEVKRKYERQAPKEVKINQLLKDKLYKSVKQFRI